MNDPCDTCNRWYECNGVDASTCPLCEDLKMEKEENDRLQ